MNGKILVVDDDKNMCQYFAISLQKNGFNVDIAHDGLDGLQKMYMLEPDLMLVDVMMPKLNGWELCQRVREISDVPVILISATNSAENTIKGLNLDAADILTKPINPTILTARIKAILRRTSASKREFPHRFLAVADGQIMIDTAKHMVTKNGLPVCLSPTEFQLLVVLAHYKGRVLAHQFLLNAVWGYGTTIDVGSVRNCIRELRYKLEDNPRKPTIIQTEWGIGYRID